MRYVNIATVHTTGRIYLAGEGFRTRLGAMLNAHLMGNYASTRTVRYGSPAHLAVARGGRA